MADSEVYPLRVKYQLFDWILQTKELLESIEKSGLVVNSSGPDSISSALALAAIEITHGMLIMVGIDQGRTVQQLRKHLPSPGGWRDVP